MVSVPPGPAADPNRAHGVAGPVLNLDLKQDLIAYVSATSIGGVNLFDGAAVVTAANVDQFTSDKKHKDVAAGRLQDMGFVIHRVGPCRSAFRAPQSCSRSCSA